MQPEYRGKLFVQHGVTHGALMQYILNTHIAEHGNVVVYVRFIANADSLQGTGQLPKFEEDLVELHADGTDF